MKKASLFEIIYRITLSIIYYTNIFLRLPRFSNNKKIILCYHSIGNNGWRFATPVKVFKGQIDFLDKHYSFLSLPQLLKSEKNGITITFDDGYRDVLENALPILEQKNIPAAMFVLGNEIFPNRQAMDNNLPLLTIQQIQQLKNRKWEIGHHSDTHSDFVGLNDEQLRQEIEASKKRLEKKLGFTLKYFAYPKGYYSQKIVSYVKKAGFEAAFTVDGDVMNRQNNYLSHRIPMEGEYTQNQFEALLSPLGIIITKIYMYLLKAKENLTQKIKRLIFDLQDSELEISTAQK